MSEFPIDDRRVYDAYIAGRQSAALAAGVRSGLFDLLDRDGPAEEPDLARVLGFAARPARGFFTALVAMGLLERRGEVLDLSEDARAYLVRDRPGSLWALIDMEVENFLSPANLLAALRSDGPSVYGGDDPWASHERDAAKAAAFTRAMHSVTERPAAGLAERLDLVPGSRILDVGGGSGALSLAICRRHPEVRCTVFELAVVCPVAQDYAVRAGLGDRVETVAGDFFAGDWPRGYDLVVLSQILHDWNFAQGEELLRSAFECLPPGGRVLIHEKLVRDESDAPLPNVLVHLDMAVWTEGQQYRPAELRDLLERVGFEDVRVEPTVGLWSMVVAARPA